MWIDGDNDGVSECYYFNQWGYLITNTHSPDGYYVDANGAWVDSGRVQTRGEKKKNFSIYGNYRLKNQEYKTAIVSIYRDNYGKERIELNGANAEGTGMVNLYLSYILWVIIIIFLLMKVKDMYNG